MKKYFYAKNSIAKESERDKVVVELMNEILLFKYIQSVKIILAFVHTGKIPPNKNRQQKVPRKLGELEQISYIWYI